MAWLVVAHTFPISDNFHVRITKKIRKLHPPLTASPLAMLRFANEPDCTLSTHRSSAVATTATNSVDLKGIIHWAQPPRPSQKQFCFESHLAVALDLLPSETNSAEWVMRAAWAGCYWSAALPSGYVHGRKNERFALGFCWKFPPPIVMKCDCCSSFSLYSRGNSGATHFSKFLPAECSSVAWRSRQITMVCTTIIDRTPVTLRWFSQISKKQDGRMKSRAESWNPHLPSETCCRIYCCSLGLQMFSTSPWRLSL